MSSSTSATWRTEMAAVGSSIRTSLALESRVRAMATAWRWPPDIFLTRSRGRVSDFSSSNNSAERSIIACLSSTRKGQIPFFCSRPRNTFSAAVRLSAIARSWYTTSIPLARAWIGLWKWQTSPSTRTSPSVGGKFPAISLTRVDLPAPLSPINPTTSPGSTDQLMSFTAWMAPKLFETLRTSSRATPAPPLSSSSSGCLRFDYSIIAQVAATPQRQWSPLLLDRLPRPHFGRSNRRIDDLLNFPRFAKIRPLPLTTSNSLQEFSHFDRLEIVETKLVTRRDAEQPIGMMLGPCLDTGVTAMAWIAVGSKMKQLIEAFLRIDKGSLDAGQFKPELHLSSCRHPVCFDRSPASPLKSN